jgi:hypothetical protein
MRPGVARNATAIFFCLVLAASELYPDNIAGQWERVDAQAPGTSLIIQLKAGDKFKCSYRRSNPDTIVVHDQKGIEREVPKMDVVRVEKSKRSGNRSVWVGALAGAIPMALLGALFGHGLGDDWGDTLMGAALLGGVGAAIGALVGFVVSKLHKDKETLYVSPNKISD